MCCPMMGSPVLDCRTASAAMAMLTARTEANYHMMGFSHTLVPIPGVNAGMNLKDVCQEINKVSLETDFQACNRSDTCRYVVATFCIAMTFKFTSGVCIVVTCTLCGPCFALAAPGVIAIDKACGILLVHPTY